MRFPAERISTFQFQSRLSPVLDLSRIINFCRNINLFLFLFVSKKRFSGQANFSLDLNKLDKSKKHQPVCRARITRLRECDFYSERIFTFQFIFFSPLGSWINFYRKSFYRNIDLSFLTLFFCSFCLEGTNQASLHLFLSLE